MNVFNQIEWEAHQIYLLKSVLSKKCQILFLSFWSINSLKVVSEENKI